MNYYNEWDKGAAAWLRELIKAGLIPNGYVDDRSITEVTPSDLEGFTQCHFFAGIGGWSYALQLAGIPANTRLWTGSPPCQPFSVAGKQLGQLDERHLAPTFMWLVGQCRPPVLFGEQVAAAIGKHWLDDLFLELERQGYACGAAVLPAASVGAPHKRDRLFFGAVGNAAHIRINRSRYPRPSGRDEYPDNGSAGSMADSDHDRQQSGGRRRRGGEPSGTRHDTGRHGESCSVADTYDTRPQGRIGVPERADKQLAGAAGVAGGMANAAGVRCQHASEKRHSEQHSASGTESASLGGGGVLRPTNPHHGFWSDADWLGCRDGKFRPVEPGTFPLAHGISARMGRLRGYGNAIVPQVAAEFIKAFTGAVNDAGN